MTGLTGRVAPLLARLRSMRRPREAPPPVTLPATDDRLLRYGTAAAVLTVATIAALVSFVHIQHLAVTHGQTGLAAALLPVSIDGTVAAASLAMLRAARTPGMRTHWLARSMLALSVMATLAANVAYGLPFGTAGALLSGWPAVAFIGSAEMSIGMVRKFSAVPARRSFAPEPGGLGLDSATLAAAASDADRIRLALAALPRATARELREALAAAGHTVSKENIRSVMRRTRAAGAVGHPAPGMSQADVPGSHLGQLAAVPDRG